MQDRVDRTLDVQVVDHIVLYEPESGIPEQMRDIVGASGTEIVHAQDVIAHLNEAIA